VRRPSLPEGLRVYAIGDVHGRADLLNQVFNLIDADLENFPPQRSLQIFLGDYIDRGRDSRAVIDLLLQRAKLYETICLKGNHEEALLVLLDKLSGFRDWQDLGGLATLMSYGIGSSLTARPDNEADLIILLKQAIPLEHFQFLTKLRSSFSCGDFFFVHAGIRPDTRISEQIDDDLLWIRDEFLESTDDFEKYIVHGHTPVRSPDIRPNRINIDTGAYASGNLTLLTIEGDRMLVLT
jgi:serine/threonine protein phosphatase 1